MVIHINISKRVLNSVSFLKYILNLYNVIWTGTKGTFNLKNLNHIFADVNIRVFLVKFLFLFFSLFIGCTRVYKGCLLTMYCVHTLRWLSFFHAPWTIMQHLKLHYIGYLVIMSVCSITIGIFVIAQFVICLLHVSKIKLIWFSIYTWQTSQN